jgi:hypothetical protein
MAISYPPKYRYTLFEPWDKEAFEFIKSIASAKQFPKIVGDRNNINQFLTALIRTQKSLHDWRDFLVDVLAQAKQGAINTPVLNKKYPPNSVSLADPAWVTYEEDKIVSGFIDELATRKVDFIGTGEEVSEFTMRFILGQLAHDWEWTIMMIWEMLGKENKISLARLNKEMKNFDYLKLFE